jgi:hypothetical protein
MPYPPCLPVKPLRKYLLQPLHNLRQLKPLLGLYEKRKSVILKLQGAEVEGEAFFRLAEYAGEKEEGISPVEQGLAVVDAGAYPVPDTLLKDA